MRIDGEEPGPQAKLVFVQLASDALVNAYACY
jgi:hypothetical protein